MNAIVTMEAILEPAAGVVLSADAIFGTGKAETIIAAIESQVRAEAYDITTPDGRERVKSVAYKIARSKTTLDDIGKEHVAAIKLQSAAIDKERKLLRDRLDALKEEVRGPLTAWEEAEERRVANHERLLAFLIESGRFDVPAPSADAIRDRMADVAVYSARDWQEFKERADAAYLEACAKLTEMAEAADQREADARELAELRRLKAEREEADAKAAWQKAENERMQKFAAEAAEKARREAEEKAEREAEAAERLRQQQEQAARDKEAAVARAIEQERKKAEADKVAAIEAERCRQEEEARQAAAKKAAEEAAELKRQQNVAHRKKVLRKVIDALTASGVPAATAAIVAVEIDEGKIPHVSIAY